MVNPEHNCFRILENICFLFIDAVFWNRKGLQRRTTKVVCVVRGEFRGPLRLGSLLGGEIFWTNV